MKLWLYCTQYNMHDYFHDGMNHLHGDTILEADECHWQPLKNKQTNKHKLAA